METKKALLIINPVSGTRSKKGVGQTVTNHLRNFGIEVIVKETKKSGDAFTMACKAVEQNFDMVITAGGDGTVNEVANALAFSNCVLGILPFGSGNGLARSVGVPQDLFGALKLIENGNVLTCDRGIANQQPFYCTFGIGFDATVSEKFASMKRRGRITYIRSAFREFLNYHSQPYAIVIKGKVITEKALLIAVCNAPQYGNNAYIGPKAKLTDGLLDITVVHADNPFHTLLMSMDMFTGMLDKNRGIGTFKVPQLTIIRTSEGPVHLDGEPFHMGKKLDIKCEGKALKVFAPEKQSEFTPFISPIRAILDDMRYDVMDKFRRRSESK
ncbi:MAG: diacylglycerol kinase family lipid kinase [Muribaculaceae bacterium]|nr:diacylglycerol kinase family lipid kinase [Muribaculaceae bacterium]